MCFNKQLEAKAVQLESDITAFKVLNVSKQIISSPMQDTNWTLGKKKIERKFDPSIDSVRVVKGFHSFKSIGNALDYFALLGTLKTKNKLFIVTIPAGSKVYINNTQYCSNQIILEDLKPIDLTKFRVIYDKRKNKKQSK